jgi:hypothetical protein
MWTDPMLTPVTWGWTPGVVFPEAINTFAGDIVSLEVSSLDNDTVTPPVGAGDPNVMGKSIAVLRPALTLAGSVMLPGEVTVTLAVALVRFGVTVVAVIMVEPGPTVVTGTATLFWFAGMVTVNGTVAAFVLEEFSVNVMLEGANTESVSERLCGSEPLASVRLAGKKLTEPVAFTTAVAAAKPFAVAVIVELPKSTPVTVGVNVDAVCPSAKKMVGDTRDTLVVSLLESDTVRPPLGAGVPNVTGNGASCPGATVTFVGSTIPP